MLQPAILERASARFAQRWNLAIARARERSVEKLSAGALSALLHVVLALILFRHADTGDMGPLDLGPLPPVFVEWRENAQAVPEEPISTQAARPATDELHEAPPRSDLGDQLEAEIAAGSVQSAVALALDAPDVSIDIDEPLAAASHDIAEAIDAIRPLQRATVVRARDVEASDKQQAMLVQRIAAVAQTLGETGSSQLTWQEDGISYEAVLTRETPSDSMALEQVVAHVTTSDHNGTSLHTQLTMQRLAFSQFTQLIDRWDPNVQLHDDVIVGRFHSNSRFYIGHDWRTAPKFSGKVTTSASGLGVTTGISRHRRDEIFAGGLQTRVERIELPRRAESFSTTRLEPDAYVHTFSDDAHVTFLPDGSYAWAESRTASPQIRRYDIDRPAYLIAENDARLYVSGKVNGHVLVYSPERIEIEGNITYVENPRTSTAADDYLGLVSDKDIVIARPYVTGRGDLRIEAAIFARRRFEVTNIEYPRTATLFIYGSLTCGTISASEPRYATKIEFDTRFDRLRPPGFPATNRYEVFDWSRTWSESASEDRH